MRALQSTGKSKTFFTWHYALVKNSLDLYKTKGLDKDIVSFFKNNIFKDYKESIRDRIKKHFTQ